MKRFLPAHDRHCLLSLEVLGLLLLMGHSLFHQHQLYGDLWQENNDLLSQELSQTSIAYFLALCSRAPCTAVNLGRPMPSTPLIKKHSVRKAVGVIETAEAQKSDENQHPT